SFPTRRSSDLRRRRQKEQVAVLMEVDRMADLVLEPLEERDRFDREADVRLVRELVADAARVAPGGSRAQQRLALEDDDVGHAAAREMVGDAGAHAPAADDDDFSRALHANNRPRGGKRSTQ